jgi:cyclopropane-fatty-acyl-phospholipid synthase
VSAVLVRAPRRSIRAVTAVPRAVVCLLLRRTRAGTLTVRESDQIRVFGHGRPAASLNVASHRTWWCLLRGSRGLADAYAAGWWDSNDLVALIRLAARNAGRLDRMRKWLAPVSRPWQAVRAQLSGNTKRRSRRAIAAHYDLGNELFSTMLDPTMTYSCAVFDRPDMTLEEAQLAKLEAICTKLNLGPGDHLLEIGTGWGSLAMYAATSRGCQVTTTTISAEQHAYVSEQVRQAGLEDRLTVWKRDWRELEGRFDKLVSVEMIEAVGWRHTGRFLASCSHLLSQRGLMLLQAITIDSRAYHVEKAAKSFINTRIFPGGSLPSLDLLARCLRRHTDLQVVGLEDITRHYVPTLQRWRASFLAHAPRLEALGYDERFRRLWSLYLAYCEAGFAERRIQDVQILLAKPQRHELVASATRAS